MSAPLRRAVAREKQAEEILGGKRIKNRLRFVSMPDLEAIRFANGTLVQPEVATRAKLPALLKQKIAQALRYSPTAVPLLVLSETGGKPYAVIPLEAFAELVGLREPKPGKQLGLLGGSNGK